MWVNVLKKGDSIVENYFKEEKLFLKIIKVKNWKNVRDEIKDLK